MFVAVISKRVMRNRSTEKQEDRDVKARLFKTKECDMLVYVWL